MRSLLLSGLLAVVGLSISSPEAFADTVDPVPTQVLTTTSPVNGVSRNPANGQLYVSGNDQVIRVFAGSATGAAVPLSSFPLGCVPWQITFNSAGSAMLVACSALVLELASDSGAVLHTWSGPTQARAALYDGGGQVFAADRSGNTVWRFNASTSGVGVTAIEGSQPASGLSGPAGIAFDGSTLYVANNGADTVTEYALTPATNPAPTPSRTLTLPADVNETESLTLDDAGNIYVAAFTGGVLAYPGNATGTATPTRRLTGPNTGSGTTDVDVLPDRSVVLGQWGGPRVASFPALVPLPPPPPPPPPAVTAPGAVTALHVDGKKTDRKRTVTWTAPAAGSSPITSYVVRVTKGQEVVASTKTTTPKLVLKRKKLKAGKLTLTVTAVSAVGAGPSTSTTFKVKLPVKRPH